MKRIGSILVLLVFLMTLIPVMPAFAEAPSAVSFNFKDLESNGTYSSAQAGYNGSSSAVKLAAAGSVVKATVASETLGTYGFTADNNLVMTTRLKFNGAATSSYTLKVNTNDARYEIWRIYGDDATGKYIFKGQTENGLLDAGKWYNIVMRFKGNLAWTYVFDDATGKQVGYKYSATYDSAPTGRALYLWSANTSADGLLIDESKMYCVSSDATFSYLESGSTAANTEIATNGEITVKFDAPITPSAAMFSVKDSSGNAVANAVESVAVKDFDTAVVKLAGLAYGATYTLDFSKVTSAATTAITGTNAIKFTTPAKALYTDSFNGTLSSSGNSFVNSEIFAANEGNGTCSIATGYNGANGLKLSGKSTTGVNAHIQTHTFETFGLKDENSSLIFTVRFKVDGEAANNVSWSINPASGVYALGTIFGGVDGKFYFDTNEQELQAGHWYNMSIAFYTTGRNEIIVNDAETGEMIRYKTVTVNANMPAKRLFIQSSNKMLTNETSITFSDAKMYNIKNTDTVNLIAADSTAPGTGIATDGTVTLAFDKPVFSQKVVISGSEVSVSSNNISVNNGASVADIKVIDFNKAVVSFNGLKYLSDYIVDYSDMVFVKSAGIDSSADGTIAFKTLSDPDNELTLKGNASCSSAEAGGVVSFDLHSKNGASPVLIVAFYREAVLEGVEIFAEDTAIAAGETKEFDLTLTKSHTSADGIKLFAWNGITNMVPLMSANNIAFP